MYVIAESIYLAHIKRINVRRTLRDLICHIQKQYLISASSEGTHDLVSTTYTPDFLHFDAEPCQFMYWLMNSHLASSGPP